MRIALIKVCKACGDPQIEGGVRVQSAVNIFKAKKEWRGIKKFRISS